MEIEKLELLLMSYGLTHLLELMDVEPLQVLLYLEEQGMVDTKELEDLL